MLTISSNSQYTKTGARQASTSISTINKKIPLEGSSITTIYDETDLGGKLNKFLQMNNVTEPQKRVMLRITYYLEMLEIRPGIEFCPGPEEEATLSFRSSDGVHLIVITSEGDIMISFSGYNFNKGWRKFYSYSNLDGEKETYEFLTSFLA